MPQFFLYRDWWTSFGMGGTQEADPSSGTNSFCAWPWMIAALLALPCIASLESCFAVA